MESNMESMRCPHCNRLLLKSAATGTIEVKCPRCKSLNIFTNKAASLPPERLSAPGKGQPYGIESRV